MQLRFVFDFEATKAAILYLASKHLPEYDKYKVCKLLFLADREHLLRFGRTITGDTYHALPFGPAPIETLNLLDGVEFVAIEGKEPQDHRVEELVRSLKLSAEERYPPYEAHAAPDMDALSESDILVLDQVAAEHGNKGFEELKKLTHSMAAYTRAWHGDDVRRNFRMSFEDFFAEVPEKADFLKEIAENQFLAQVFADPTECLTATSSVRST
jgi:uncharacterized phage-associated protein